MRLPKGHPLGENYELLELLGEGSYARVYRARDLVTGELVAIKRLKESLQADAQVVERFRREILAISSIECEHVAKLRDFGLFEGEMYLATELIVGTTLREAMQSLSWTAADAHVIVGQIAEAVSVAHEASITHRDLKPENVMLSRAPDGALSVKVVDFGMAKLHALDQSTSQLSTAGMVYGTPHYLSPEVIYGDPATAAVDLWAIAIIAYELIALRRPWFGGSPALVIRAIATQPVPAITKADEAIEGRLPQINAFFERALAIDPTLRPSSAAALFRAFSDALFGDARPGPPAGERSYEFIEVTRGTVTLPQGGPKGRAREATSDFESAQTVAESPAERCRAVWIPSLSAMERPIDEPAPQLDGPSGEIRTSSFDRGATPARTNWTLVLIVGLCAMVLTTVLGLFLGARYGAPW